MGRTVSSHLYNLSGITSSNLLIHLLQILAVNTLMETFGIWECSYVVTHPGIISVDTNYTLLLTDGGPGL